MHLDVVVFFFLWTGIVPSLWEFVWNTSRNGICLYYYLEYLSLGRLYFTHNSGWHPASYRKRKQIKQGISSKALMKSPFITISVNIVGNQRQLMRTKLFLEEFIVSQMMIYHR